MRQKNNLNRSAHQRPRSYLYRRWRLGRWRNSAGITLMELLVTTVVTSVVIMLVFQGVVTAMNAQKIMQSKLSRRTEMARASEFIGHEINMARRINQTETLTSGPLTDIVASSGINLAQLGDYGNLAMYLELPMTAPAAVCPAGTPRAGLAPETTDHVVYDVRPSNNGWLGPKGIYRYGRVPNMDGTLDPCSQPIGSDILVDAIAATSAVKPTCTAPAVLTGTEGFYACVDGTKARLLFQSEILGAESREFEGGAATSRLVFVQPEQAIQLKGKVQGDKVTVDLDFKPNRTLPSPQLKVQRTIGTTTTALTSLSPSAIPKGSGTKLTLSLGGNVGEENCFKVAGQDGNGAAVESNLVCFVRQSAPAPNDD